ncbi:MAG: hypothetical protein WC889_02925 [Myxococcota bacterium]|jgi:hypothetical protein
MRDRNDERETAVFSASSVLDVIGEALSAIRREDRLTFADIAAVLGKSEDQAAKYCAGSATMDAITFARAKREWNGRFTGGYDRLCANSRPGNTSDRAHGSSILRAALALSEALEDGKIDAKEVHANRGTLENARDAIEAQLAKLQPAKVSA